MSAQRTIDRVVLAYSGGLDTSVILKWIMEEYDAEVIAYTADVGQGDEVAEAKEKAIATGAVEAIAEDLTDEFVVDYVFPALRASAIYEGYYLLGTSLARPVIAKGLVRAATEFGADAIVIALDVRIEAAGRPVLTTQGWTEETDTSLWECLDEYEHAGVKHVLCTDVLRDGTLTGPNFDLYADILNRYPALQLQASGGVRDIDDLELLRELGVPAAISGKALLDGRITAEEIRSFRQSE